MTPVPEVVSLDELSRKLETDCRRALGRPASRNDKLRSELLEEESAFMLPLPSTRFQACITESTKVSKFLLVRFDKNDYSVPMKWAYSSCVVKGFVDRVDIYMSGSALWRLRDDVTGPETAFSNHFITYRFWSANLGPYTTAYHSKTDSATTWTLCEESLNTGTAAKAQGCSSKYFFFIPSIPKTRCDVRSGFALVVARTAWKP